ncbi:hypothetical protein PFISCL1PPCAC_21279, partial [Pristionchus fissidentatus]
LLRDMKLRSLHLQNDIGMPEHRLRVIDRIHLSPSSSLINDHPCFNRDAVILDESLLRINQIVPCDKIAASAGRICRVELVLALKVYFVLLGILVDDNEVEGGFGAPRW